MIVASPNGASQVRVQVKASSGGRANPRVYVKAKSRRQFDVLVFVDLGGGRETTTSYRKRCYGLAIIFRRLEVPSTRE